MKSRFLRKLARVAAACLVAAAPLTMSALAATPDFLGEGATFIGADGAEVAPVNVMVFMGDFEDVDSPAIAAPYYSPFAPPVSEFQTAIAAESQSGYQNADTSVASAAAQTVNSLGIVLLFGLMGVAVLAVKAREHSVRARQMRMLNY